MFIRAANPIWYMPDLIGQPLSDAYYAFFLTNTFPYLPQNVYRDPQGTIVWTGNVVQFLANGTLPNNLYFDPSLVYRIEVRRGNSQADPLIYEVNNFVPGNGGGSSGNELAILGTENLIANPQFSQINFVSPLTLTTAGVHPIAPGWDLVLVGAGSTELTQLILSGTDDQVNNPPFALRINSTGWSQVSLRQRFTQNGALWANGAVSMSVTARAQISSETISLAYSPNSPGTPQQIATASLGTADYEVVAGAIDLPASTNTTASNNAYVDMLIQLPTSGAVDITNVQVIGQSDPLPANFDPLTDIPSYQQQSEERIIDHLFHHFAQELIIKPKKSLLVGWNFPLNPFQFNATALTTAAAQTQYICDQTIIHQEATSQVQTGKNSVDQRENLLIQAVDSATQTRFALIQYIDASSIRPYWSYVLSAFARARIFTSHATSVRLKCRLIYRASIPSTISATEPIASWAAGSDPVFAAGWTALTPLNDPAYVLPNAYANDESAGANAYPGFAFNGFQLPNASNADMTLGIVIYTMDNLNSSTGTEDAIAFDKISLIPSAFGADALPQTYDECLRECEFYYEKSYPAGVLPGSNTFSGIRYSTNPLGGDYSSTVLYKTTFNLVFNQVKRNLATVTFYDVAGNLNTVRLGTYDGAIYPVPDAGNNPSNEAISQWDVETNTPSGILLKPIGTSAVMTFNAVPGSKQGEIFYHYVADARIGR